MPYSPITRSGMAVVYSLAAVGMKVMLSSVLWPGCSTEGLLATCSGRVVCTQRSQALGLLVLLNRLHEQTLCTDTLVDTPARCRCCQTRRQS